MYLLVRTVYVRYAIILFNVNSKCSLKTQTQNIKNTTCRCIISAVRVREKER